MSKTKRSLINILCSVIAQIVTIGLGLVVPRITMVGYGSEVNGLLNSVSQIIIYLGLFEAGIQAVAMQSLYKPVSITDRGRINSILAAVHTSYRKTGIMYFAGLLAVAALYPLLVSDSGIGYFTVFFVVLFSGLPNVVLFLFQGKYKILLQAEGKNYILTNLTSATTVVNNIIKIVLLLLGMNVVVVVFASFVVSLLQAIFIVAYFRLKYKWIDLKVKPDYSALEQKNSALIHQIAGLIFQNTDVLILTVFCDLKVVSVYSMYKLVVTHLSTVLNIPFSSITFALGQSYNTDRPRFVRLIDTTEVVYGALSFSVYSVFLALMYPFMELYTKGVNDIEYADMLLVVLFAAVELLTFARTPMLNTINYAGHFKKTLPQTVIETVINLAVSLSTVYFFGIAGVLAGTAVALLYRTIDIIIYSNVRLLSRKPFKTFSVYLVNTAVLLIFQFVFSKLGVVVDSYADFILAGAALTATSLLLHFSVSLLIYGDERRMIFDLLKNKLRHKG